MKVVFRCEVTFKVTTSTNDFDMVTKYRFRQDGFAECRHDRNSEPKWDRLGTWRWDEVNQQVVVNAENSSTYAPDNYVQIAWDNAYREYIQSRLLT